MFTHVCVNRRVTALAAGDLHGSGDKFESEVTYTQFSLAPRRKRCRFASMNHAWGMLGSHKCGYAFSTTAGICWPTIVVQFMVDPTPSTTAVNYGSPSWLVRCYLHLLDFLIPPSATGKQWGYRIREWCEGCDRESAIGRSMFKAFSLPAMKWSCSTSLRRRIGQYRAQTSATAVYKMTIHNTNCVYNAWLYSIEYM